MLHQLVAENLETLLAVARIQSATGAGYPRFIEDEFRAYLRCGILAYGCVFVLCSSCGERRVLGFSCGGRGICPSCAGRRMNDVSLELVDDVLPVARYRQWTLSLPWSLRRLLLMRPQLVGVVLGIFVKRVFAWQRRQAKGFGLIAGGERAESGAVSFFQKFGSRLNVHPHFHVLIADGVWVLRGEARLFIALPEPSDDDVLVITRGIAKRVLGLAESESEAAEQGGPSDGDDEQQLLAQAAEPEALPTQGEERRGKYRRQSALVEGFSLDAQPNVAPANRAGLARMLRYGARPAFSQERLEILPSGKVSYRLAKPFYTGQTHVTLEPVVFLRRLAALIPQPRLHLVGYFGVFASRSSARAEVIATVPGKQAAAEAEAQATSVPLRMPGFEEEAESPGKKRNRHLWAELHKRTFGNDVLKCVACGGRCKVVGYLTSASQPEALAAALERLGEPTSPPVTAPARAPPQPELFALGEFGAEPNFSGESTDHTWPPQTADPLPPDWA